jgi:hypothetical protein
LTTDVDCLREVLSLVKEVLNWLLNIFDYVSGLQVPDDKLGISVVEFLDKDLEHQ